MQSEIFMCCIHDKQVLWLKTRAVSDLRSSEEQKEAEVYHHVMTVSSPQLQDTQNQASAVTLIWPKQSLNYFLKEVRVIHFCLYYKQEVTPKKMVALFIERLLLTPQTFVIKCWWLCSKLSMKAITISFMKLLFYQCHQRHTDDYYITPPFKSLGVGEKKNIYIIK